jgi:hypothetical protein
VSNDCSRGTFLHILEEFRLPSRKLSDKHHLMYDPKVAPHLRTAMDFEQA